MLQNIVTCQLKLNLPKLVQQNACGVACILQVLKFKNVLKQTNEDVFLDFLRFGKYTFPRVELELEGLPQPIPYSILDPSKKTIENTQKEISELFDKQELTSKNIRLNSTVNNEYLPTFLLKTGSDSRGICEYLRSLGITSKLYELSIDKNTTNKNIKHTIYSDLNTFMDTFSLELNQEKMIIASVKMEALTHLKEVSKIIYKDNISELTHLVCIKKEKGSIYIIDPLIEQVSSAIVETNLDQLRVAMTKNRIKSRFIVIN